MEFKFNICIPRAYKDKETQETKYALCKGNEKMQVLTLLEAQKQCNPNRPKNGQPWGQLFNNGYRVTNDNIDWKDWNGFTFTDIDCKHFYNNVQKFNVGLLFESLWYQALIKNKDNFYCIYLSASKSSYRILWYWDCERTEDNFNKCCVLSDKYTKELFYSLGSQAAQIIDYENGKSKVLDSCAHSSKQGFYITENEIKFGASVNSEQFGKCDLSNVVYEVKSYRASNIMLGDIEQHNMVSLKGIKTVSKTSQYYPHHMRWCIYEALIVVFKDKERVDKEWERICRLMPEENGHNYNFYKNEPERNKWYKRFDVKIYHDLNWLKPFGYDIEDISDIKNIKLEKGQYLSDVQYKIEKLIETNNYRCEIVAPTGTGKTVLINGSTCKQNIFEHTDGMTGIAQKYNAVVIVPYNMTNSLYSNLTCISSDNGMTKKENEKIITKGGPLVMVFDQFLIYKDMLADRTIILDEAHTIFTDKTYRASVVQFADFVVKKNMKIIAFTATPEIEADVLKIPKFEIEAYSKRIRVNLIDFVEYESRNEMVNPNVFNFEIKLIDRLKDGEQLVFFDNKNSRNLEDYIKHTRNEDCVTVVRADTKKNDKVVQLRETEMIETPFLVSTKAGFQGLNYMNENKITAVINFEYMSSYKSDIFQSIGRFRKSADINAIVLYSHKDVKSVTDRISLAEDKNQVYEDLDSSKFNIVDQSILDEDQQNIMFEMENYFLKNSTYESVLDELKKHKNIKLYEKKYSCSNAKYDNQEKRDESNKFIEKIADDKWNYNTGNVYWDKNVELMRELKIEKITNKMILDIIATKKNNVLFETIADELLTIINIANRGSVEEIKVFEKKLKDWVDTNKGTAIDYDLYKYFKRQLALVKKTIKIKKRMIEENRDVNDFISAVIDEFLNEQTEVKHKESEAGKKGAKKRNKQVKDLKTNEIYESLTDFAAAYGKSVSWVSKHKTYWEPID